MIHHTGFYKDKRRTWDVDDFGFLEKEELFETENGTFKVGDFLHGWCEIFAYMLHRRFGWPIEVIRDEDGFLIHAYCVRKVKDRFGKEIPAFVDVRGETTDYREFINEFWDYLDYDFPIEDVCYSYDEDCRLSDADLKKEIAYGYELDVFEGSLDAAEKIFETYGFWKAA